MALWASMIRIAFSSFPHGASPHPQAGAVTRNFYQGESTWDKTHISVQARSSDKIEARLLGEINQESLIQKTQFSKYEEEKRSGLR